MNNLDADVRGERCIHSIMAASEFRTRFEQKGRQVLLHPENEEFSTIVVDLAQQVFAIEGLAVGIIRNGASL